MNKKRLRNLALGLLLCIYIIIASIYVNTIYNQVMLLYQQQIANSAYNLELFLNGRVQALRAMAEQPEVASLEPTAIRPRLVRLSESFSLSNAAIFDREGLFLTSVDLNHPKWVGDFPTFEVALSGQPVISNRIKRKGFDNLFISIRVPVRNEHQDIVAVLSAGISNKEIVRVLNYDDQNTNFELMLLDGNQELIHHDRLSDLLPYEGEIKRVVTGLPLGRVGTSYARWTFAHREENLLVFMPIRNTEWHLVGTIPAISVYLVIAQEALTGLVAITLTVLCIGLSIHLWHRIRQHKIELDAQRMEHLALINQLAAGVAHEIRNPLTSIKGFIQYSVIKRTLNIDHMGVVLEEIDRIEELTNEFRLLTRPQEPQSLVEVDLASTVNSSVMLLRSQALAKCVEIVYEPENELYPIKGNLNLLKQLWINLLKNAIEAVHIGGRVEIKLYCEGDTCTVHIQDNGNGIPKDILKRLGTPFFTTKDNGTGLGLSVSYNIVHQHRGQIEFVSEPQQGTSVLVTFPRYTDKTHL